MGGCMRKQRLKKIATILLTGIWLFFGLCALAGCKKESKGYTRYEITAEYAPENRTLAGTAKVTYQHGGGSTSVLKFQLYPNAYRKDALYSPVGTGQTAAAYYAGESYGEMVISSVNGAKSWEVMGEDENILYVHLPETLFEGDKVVLDIGFLTKLAKVRHRTGITEKTVNLGNFYPILCGVKNGGFYETVYYADGNPFFSDCADYSLQLTLPKEYTVVSSGWREAERVLESKKVYTASGGELRDFAITLSRAFRSVEQEINGKEIVYYYCEDETPEDTLSVAAQAFAYYEKTFGAYPFERYTVVETGLCLDFASYSCLLMVSENLSKEARVQAIAEGMARQWWYGVVGCDQIENGWQSEGLSAYAAASFFETHPDYGLSREKIVTESLKEYRSYYDVYGSVLGRTDTRMNKHLSEFVSGYEYRCLSRDKALVMLDTLRKSVGDKKFYAGLRRYYNGNRFLTADAGALIGAFEKAGVDAYGFFDGFLSGKGIL